MIDRFLVLPPEPSLMIRVGPCRGVVPVVDNVEVMGDAVHAAQSASAHLHCLWVRTKAPLEAICLDRAWEGTPIAIEAPGMGRVKDVIGLVQQWRRMNVRIYLPTTRPENLTALRILSSLGVETALVFDETQLDWEGIADLMGYALLGRSPRAPIAPFNTMVGSYRASGRSDFGQYHFENPAVYLHLDREGRVALTRRDLLAGRFAASSLEDFGDPDRNEHFIAHRTRWCDDFLTPGGCASCPGWRLCGGRFAEGPDGGNGCREFFLEWMDALEKVQAGAQPRISTWQP